ncbi:CHAT domain-containing protein [Xanthomonas sp. CFBP 8445]|uniref:CHAT domain-containing protein n=1 Tax=Xanthomonas sp. CFBP 8445 TaxID=2971236 RepID=UPI0021E098E8|nr:CHAT domain-containing protein [Xanthomonas sp. CFBP 8445]UYC14026.1 CHAT domain-containing protein [Xanthomonas sp. CFBP 8445]
MDDQDPMNHDPLAQIKEQLSQCNDLLRTGEIGAALQLLDSIKMPSEEDRKFLRINMLHAADLPVQAYEELKTLSRSPAPNPEALLLLALVCANAGADIDAENFLRAILNEPLLRSSIEKAIATALQIRSNDLALHFENRVLEEDPATDQARQIRWYRALTQGDFIRAVGNISAQDHRLREPLYALQMALVDTNPPDYTKALSACNDCPRGTAVPVAAVKHILRQGAASEAIRIAKTFASNPRGPEVGALLDVLDWLLLHRSKHSWPTMANDAETLILGVIDYLSTRTMREGVRSRLISLLSVERSGDYGLPIIVSTMLRLSRIQIVMDCPSDAEFIRLDRLEQNGFLREAFTWLSSRSPCVPGRTILPAHILRDPPDAVVTTVSHLISSWDDPLASEEEIEHFMHWVLLGTSVAPHAKRPNQDISLIRVAATQLANAGQAQLARNLCEQILLSSVGSKSRAQAAWFAMSDIYARTSDLLTSCVAFACALRSCSEGQLITGWNELNSLVCLLRAARLFDWARDALRESNAALQSIDHYASVSHQQDFLGLTIDMQEVLTDPPSYRERLPPLVVRACDNAREVMERKESPTQILIMLSQLIDICTTVGVEAPTGAVDVQKALRGQSAQGNSLAAAVGIDDSASTLMFNLYRSIGDARYSNDAAHDSSKIAILARNYLTLNAAKVAPEELLVAFEMCADGGVAAPGWIANPRPPARFQAPEAFLVMAEYLRQRGIALVMGTLNNRGELLTLRVNDGVAHLIEETGFSYSWFQNWEKTYPYAYGNEKEGVQSFYSDRELMLHTLDGCNLAAFPGSATLVIMDTELRSIPPNILLANGVLAGSQYPIGAAPSLTWLAEAYRREQTGDGRLCAWISNGGAGESLNMLVENLAPTFEEHGFHFDTGSEVPIGIGGADLAIIAAHGNVSPEGQYFHALNDEGTLKIPAEALATALRNVRVVVLFVCNGGRSDKVPGANTTSGLAKQLLNAGCSTVIASPWPIQAVTALAWIPEFLRQWQEGSNIMEACFRANQAIAGENPSRNLAMNLFGDPCQCRSPVPGVSVSAASSPA